MQVIVTTPLTYRRPDLQNKPVEIEEGRTLKQFMKEIKLPDSFVDHVIVNDKKAELSQQLTHGDRVAFFPMMAGG